MLWRGKDIPEEVKSINCYDKMSFKKLDEKDEQKKAEEEKPIVKKLSTHQRNKKKNNNEACRC